MFSNDDDKHSSLFAGLAMKKKRSDKILTARVYVRKRFCFITDNWETKLECLSGGSIFRLL
jgi:hypothetical protein